MYNELTSQNENTYNYLKYHGTYVLNKTAILKLLLQKKLFEFRLYFHLLVLLFSNGSSFSIYVYLNIFGKFTLTEMKST